MRSAPVVVLCLSDPQRYLDRYAEPDKGWTDRDDARWPVPYWDVDTGMASLLVLLGAVDEGLGGCFFGVPPERHDAVRAAFGVPDDRRLVGALSLGHPAPDRRSPSLRRGRRPVAEVAHDGRFGTPFAADGADRRAPEARRGPGRYRPTPAATARQNGSSVSSAVSIPRWVSTTAATSRTGSPRPTCRCRRPSPTGRARPRPGPGPRRRPRAGPTTPRRP